MVTTLPRNRDAFQRHGESGKATLPMLVTFLPIVTSSVNRSSLRTLVLQCAVTVSGIMKTRPITEPAYALARYW